MNKINSAGGTTGHLRYLLGRRNMETWRDVIGYESWYQISNLGQVKRVKPGPGARVGRILKTRDVFGYSQVDLCRNGKIEAKFVHVLVLDAFIDPHPFGYECNHKNGAKADNHLENLEWVTHSGNMRHSYRVLGKNIGTIHYNAKLTEGKILEIRKLYETKEYTQKTLGDMFGCSDGNISDIVSRRTWKHI